MRHVRLERHGDAVVISWDEPVNRDTIDRIRAYVSIERRAHTSGRMRIDQAAPFPTEMHVNLPKIAKWYDVEVDLDVTNTDDSGAAIGFRWQEVNDVSPAPHGSRISKVLSAGRHAVDVVGGISPANAERVCDNRSCVGELATLVIDRGREVQRVPVRYNAEGAFHATIWIPKGAESVKLRIEGPKTLDSGPFDRYSIGE